MPLSRITSPFMSATANVYSPSANTIAIKTQSTDRVKVEANGQFQLFPAADADLVIGDFVTTSNYHEVRLQSSDDGVSTGFTAVRRTQVSNGSVANSFTRLTGSGIIYGTDGLAIKEYVPGGGGAFTTRLTFPTGAAGITFPSSQAASSDANTLDDYEEGTWTPIFQSSGTTYTYGNQYGYYIKIGSFVLAQFYLRVTAYSGTDSNVQIAGFPFTTWNNSAYNQSPGAMWSTTTTQAVGLITNNGTSADLWKQGSSVTIFTASEITGVAKYFVGSFSYRAT